MHRLFTMHHYAHRLPDGSVHVQNAVGPSLGQHHAHTAEDYTAWAAAIDPARITLRDSAKCCDLAPGWCRDGAYGEAYQLAREDRA